MNLNLYALLEKLEIIGYWSLYSFDIYDVPSHKTVSHKTFHAVIQHSHFLKASES